MWQQLDNFKKSFRSDDAQYVYHQSLITHFGEMLLYAQELYGKRDETYTILGIHIAPNAQNIYPVNGWAHKQLIVQISEHWLKDWHQLLFWTAHEAFHCLRPTPKWPVNRFEEGFATHFASQYMGAKMNWNLHNTGDAKYDEAWRDVKQFIKEGGDLMAIGQASNTPFAELTIDTIANSIGGNIALATELAQDF